MSWKIATHAVLILSSFLLAAAAHANARGPCGEELPRAGILGCIGRFENPEDVAYVASESALLVSEIDLHEQGGGLSLLQLGPAGEPLDFVPSRVWPGGVTAPDGSGDEDCKQPSAKHFRPHGIDVGKPEADGAVPIFVVNHGKRESVQIFALQEDVLTWRGCYHMPDDASGNDVAVGPNGELAVSDYQPTQKGLRNTWYAIKGGLGFETGSIFTRRPGIDSGWVELEGSAGVNPNGVIWSEDGKSIFFAETGAGAVRRVPYGDGPKAGRIEIEGYPDNLSRGADGRILVVTHHSGFAVLLCRMRLLPCRSGWSLFEIQPDLSAKTELLSHSGDQLGGAASAVIAQDWIYIGAIFDDRIGIWRPGTD